MKILIIDLETSGLTFWHSIVELGLVSFNLRNGKVSEVLDIICKERDKLLNKHAWIFDNSNLTYRDVNGSDYLEGQKEGIQAIFNNYEYITCYNHEFDLALLRDRGFDLPTVIFDPMKVLTPIMKLDHWYYKYKYPSVEEVYRYLFPNEEYTETHRAIEDAKDEARIVYKIITILQEKEKSGIPY